MHLAIFMDAAAVAGDAGLLHKARQFAFEILPGNDAFLARFAAAADQFDEPVGWWARLTSLRARDELPFDLKKLGTFPIVHGVRALALQAQVTHAEHRRAPARAGRAPAHRRRPGARPDRGAALHDGPEAEEQPGAAPGRPAVDNLVRMSGLSTLERDRLQDALGIIKRFRQHLQQHFKLDAL